METSSKFLNEAISRKRADHERKEVLEIGFSFQIMF